jgi:hypothetical protein
LGWLLFLQEQIKVIIIIIRTRGRDLIPDMQLGCGFLNGEPVSRGPVQVFITNVVKNMRVAKWNRASKGLDTEGTVRFGPKHKSCEKKQPCMNFSNS